ncbi:hypothetical protein ASPCADRAFT_706 [Aspergillus carbonarius ITEM 5010]|uniref:Uncharacterized protein n=1 Tax=Aspergillus carbonarius (strain ITEM 5010) TaxID=602072 RepID=A0A1R3S2F5_ASPC5|nr:hypothetical protein ASPCADRAFT_706 [Aspergillus carbonarius ITEM 5010]
MAAIQYLSNNSQVYREFLYFDDAEREWRVNFRGLHRMILARLQENLISEIGEIKRSGFMITDEGLARLEPLLTRYTQAVRDFDYMAKSAENAHDDISKDLFVRREMGYRSQDVPDQGSFLYQEGRLLVALVITAIFVLLPMIVMVLHRDKTTALIVSSAFTVAFALLVAALDIKADVAIGVVAAYTAVLGTFVVSTL